MPTRSGERASPSGAARLAVAPSLIAAALLAALVRATPYSDGPPPASTGGFGEPSCHSCHFDGPLNSSPGTLSVDAPTSYQPGARYELAVRLRRPDLTRGGFQLSARYAAGSSAGEQAGSLRAKDASVKVVTAAKGAGIQYAEHTAPGTQADESGAIEWTVVWDAPTDPRGPVIFHTAANASNHDDSEFGDHIYLDSLTVPPAGAMPNGDPGSDPVQLSGTNAELRGISAADTLAVWAAGRGGVYSRSADGGKTWTSGIVPGAEELFLIDVHAVSADSAYLLGTYFDGGLGAIYKTIDGGVRWTEQFRAEGEGVFFDGMAFWDPRNGVAFSDPVDGAFLIVVTDDGGATWRRVPQQNVPPPLPGEAGFAASGTAITVYGEGDVWFGTGGATLARVFHSDDRGRTWTVSSTSLPAGPSAGIFGLAFRDREHGVAVGGDHRTPRDPSPNVARTSDGGRTWRVVAASAPAGVRYGATYASGADGSILVAVGPSGSGYSLDDGDSWTALDKTGYNTVAPASGGRVWVGGVAGRVSALKLPAR
jgi:photosystem II stability/assembly factor-like uncharacterized protein